MILIIIGGSHVVDNRCHTGNFVGAGISVTGYTIGNFIHILLVIAIIVVLVRVIQGRKIL
jgi:hypothetical protein